MSEAVETQPQGTLETRKDAGEGEAGVVKLWLDALALADREEGDWRKRAADTIDIYRDAKDRKSKRYNILYANTETLAPALYNSEPIPDVRRRFGDEDPIGRVISQILDRSISYTFEAVDLNTVMKAAVKDVCLPGRCVTRVRYEPTMNKMRHRIGVIDGKRVDNNEPAGGDVLKDDSGEYIEGDEYDKVSWEAVGVEHVQWADFRRGPAKTWAGVPWIAFRHFLAREEVVKLNSSVGASINLDTSIDKDKKPENGSSPEPDIFKRLLVWEIWDKVKREVVWIAPSYSKSALKTEEDPLNLKDFYPIPKPIYAVDVPETLVPVEPYRLYKDQADELDEINRRLASLTRVMKWRGLFAQSENGGTELTSLKDAEDGDLVPSQSAFNNAMAGGDINKQIWLMPIKEVAEVIDRLSIRQEAVKKNIFEIMGVADIMRGDTKASETATAQRIKGQWGSLRLQQMQSEVQRYVRDLCRMIAEIVAEKFSPETLATMTGIQLPTQQQLLQAQAQAQMAAAMGQGQQQAPIQGPTWEDVIQVMRDDHLRCYRVDIETDSTIQADVQKQQENIGNFVNGFAQYLGAIGPAIKEGAIDQKTAVEIMKSFARTFKLPRQAADALDKLGMQAEQNQGGAQDSEKIKAQAEQQKAQAEIEKTQLDGQISQQKHQLEMQKIGAELEATREEHRMKMAEMAAKHEQAMAMLQMKAVMPQRPAGAPVQ